MMSIQREEQHDYFAEMMQKIVSEWDPYINNLKNKKLPLQPNELAEVQSRRQDLCDDLDWIYCLDKESPIKALMLKLSRKLRYDFFFFKHYDDEAHDKTSAFMAERHAQCQTHVILAELEAIDDNNEDDDDEEDALAYDVNAEHNATDDEHLEEDFDDSKDDEADVLDASSQAKVKAAKKRTKKRKLKPLKAPLSPRPMKLRKAMTMKILMRRKTVLNRVRNLLNPDGWPQCHLSPLRKRVNPAQQTQYKCTQHQPVSGQNRRLPSRRHLGNCGPNPQSRARSSRLHTKADEASLGKNTTLLSEGQLYNLSFPNEEDTYYNADSLLGNAVKVCRWLFHHHFI